VDDGVETTVDFELQPVDDGVGTTVDFELQSVDDGVPLPPGVGESQTVESAEQPLKPFEQT
jgi:hypothetical protein